MNTRPLTAAEEANLSIVREAAADFSLLFLTKTGLEKSILDATLPVRTLLLTNGIHDYSTQGQGPSNKVTIDAHLLADAGHLVVKASLYRPVTKNGDPRIWFGGLPNHASPDEVVVLFVAKTRLYLMNLSRTRIAEFRETGISGEVLSLLQSLGKSLSAVADELLAKLRAIALDGPLESVCAGSTGIGRSIEARLGIKMNSSKTPDYRGIEIKSGRSNVGRLRTRPNLFACVPDWSLSPLKNFNPFLAEFGYVKRGARRLNCTVSTRSENSQHLVLRVEAAKYLLLEACAWPSFRPLLIWSLPELHKRLCAKHPETFWIKATSIQKKGKEHFLLRSVTHTRSPSPTQFDQLLIAGEITMDHLMKQDGGHVHERGPLFKIRPDKLELLFKAPAMTHDLTK